LEAISRDIEEFEVKNFEGEISKIWDIDFEEYCCLCELETTALGKTTTMSLKRILKEAGISKKMFDFSFLKIGDKDIEVRQIMKNTFTRLNASINRQFYGEIRKNFEEKFSVKNRPEKKDITGPLLLEVLEFRISIYPHLKMFNGAQQPIRKYSRLKFMSDLIFFKFGLEDEDMYLDSPHNNLQDSNEYKLNPKLRKVAQKIQSLLQTNF